MSSWYKRKYVETRYLMIRESVSTTDLNTIDWAFSVMNGATITNGEGIKNNVNRLCRDIIKPDHIEAGYYSRSMKRLRNLDYHTRDRELFALVLLYVYRNMGL